MDDLKVPFHCWQRWGQPRSRNRAFRRLEANSPKLNLDGWLEAWTDFDPKTGFHYRIVGQGGSSRIRERVPKCVLEAEERANLPGEAGRAALIDQNYSFSLGGSSGEGLFKVVLKPRRADARLIDGAIFLTFPHGEPVRLEGLLSKSPSFWPRTVSVIRHYGRIAGRAMPIEVESWADVKIAGPSRFLMTYEYEMVNGQCLASRAADLDCDALRIEQR